jgi:hypothetical protein
VKVTKRNPSNQNGLEAERITALAKKAGRLAKANRKKGYH